MKKKILIVVGTRPNFIKITQFKKAALRFKNTAVKIVHTGQHYDKEMAGVFFEQFGLVPDFFLNVPSSTALNTQMAGIMLALEKVINKYKPNLLVVVGDVNSTLAAALAGNRMGIKIAHIESGLRSYDQTMPEEYNRTVTDKVADYLFVSEKSGIENLKKEGKDAHKVFFVGNTMIDTLTAFEKQILSSPILDRLNISSKEFVLMTMHRPATVDDQKELAKLLALIRYITPKYKLVFPIHPRTRKKLEEFNMLSVLKKNSNLILCDPLDYFAFQHLILHSRFILTDSGGIQEESTFRKIPCLTLRPNTERPSTVELGTNTLVPFELKKIAGLIKQIEAGRYKKGRIPPLWDGKSTSRILKILDQQLR